MKEIQNYPQYFIDEKGNIWSQKSKKFLKQQLDKDGYFQVTLSKQGKTKRFFVHRLVAESFLEKPNTEEFLTVDHINRNRQDNRIENLRWATSETQIANKDFSNLKQCLGIGVWLCDKNTHEHLKHFNSIKDCARYLGNINKNVRIGKVLKNQAKSAYGYFYEIG